MERGLSRPPGEAALGSAEAPPRPLAAHVGQAWSGAPNARVLATAG